MSGPNKVKSRGYFLKYIPNLRENLYKKRNGSFFAVQVIYADGILHII